ncbi:hypothetical protein C8R46DRAFT_905700, partial [Mycena filopes]
IRSRVPQFRGKVKTLARVYVPAAYELVDIQTLRDPTPEKVEAQVSNALHSDFNRLYLHVQNPDNITPDTMFGNSVFSNVFTAFFFGTGDNNRAFYFEGETQVQLATLALIIVLCAIDEWSTGRWENKAFSHTNYHKMYDATLAGLKKWMAHSEKWVAEGRTSTNATTELLERMLRNARYVRRPHFCAEYI